MAAKKPNLDTVWKRITALEWREFHTKLGLPFTFEIEGDVLRTSRTEYNLPKSEIGKALARVPIDGPGEINEVVRGPAYIWAILHDPRVRGTDW